MLPRLSVLSLTVVLSACGGGSDNQPAAPLPAKAQVSGVFLDSAVEGLEYVSGSSARAITSAKGAFTCTEGDSVGFTLGGINLGSAPCAATLTPLQLAASTDTTETKVVNRLLALQLLDEDGDPANGIKLSPDLRTVLAGRTLDFNAPADSFNATLVATLAAAGTRYTSRTVDADRRMLAREHFENTLAVSMNKPVTEKFTQGAIDISVTRYQVQTDSKLNIPYEGSNAKVKEDFPLGFLPSFGSALAFKGVAANGDLEFYGLTDRGPNGDGPNVPPLGGSGITGSKIFPAPGFTPSIGIITVGKAGAVLNAVMPIKVSASVNSTGLPIPEGSLGNSAEVPVMDAMKFDAAGKAVFNANGIDSEAIAFDRKRNALWISDEYGPFIVKVDAATGVIQSRHAPGIGLPKIFAKRRANRGMEGLSLDTSTDRLHGFLQSPLSDGTAHYAVTGKNEQVERFARFTRWIVFDPAAGVTTRMYAYPIDAADYQDGRTGNAKLGDVVALGNGKFIVIEQGADPKGRVFNRLMLVEVGAATDIAGAAYNADTSDLEKSSMAGSAVNGADWSKVVPLKKTLLLDLNAIGWLAEKAEGLTVVDANTLAIANDNDFGLKTKVFAPSGTAVADADVSKCNVDAAGAIVTSGAVGCNAANTIRVAPGADGERPSRLWLIKFSKPLASY